MKGLRLLTENKRSMEKLKKLIVQLPEQDYVKIETELVGNKSEKFLLLLQSFRLNGGHDNDLLLKLQCNENALYVLKSRLYDKVQKHLVQTTPSEKESQESNTLLPGQLIYEFPRETARAILHELEKKYLEHDVPGELMEVYSALKKVYSNTEKYYVYSQLYNKQAAYTMALEKAEDVLFNFNRTLSHYTFSRSECHLELMKVLKGEINNIYALNQSHRIELIKNYLAIQIQLFTSLELNDEEALEDLLDRSEKLVADFPNDKQIKYYQRALNYFRFEYYLKINQPKKAMHYFDLTEKLGQSWLLLSPICLPFKFLLSKISFLTRSGRVEELSTRQTAYQTDSYDFCTEVVLRLYMSLVKFYTGKVKESSGILNELLNDASFKDFFHAETEIKLTLAYFYIKQTQYELAENLLKSVSRKLNDHKKEGYANAKAFVKYLNLLMDDKNSEASKGRIKEALELFYFHNTNGHKILEFLLYDLDQGHATA